MTRRELLAAIVAAPGTAPGAGQTVDLIAGAKSAGRYVVPEGGWKPYIHPVCAPCGAPITLDAPHDHLHHHGLMIGWSDIGGFDFWAESPPERCGRQIQKDIQTTGRSGLTARLEWTAEGRCRLRERRLIRVEALAPDAIAIDWTSEFRGDSGDIKLTAHKLGFDGLGLRFARSMDGGEVLNSRGETTFERVSGQPARWCAYTGLVDSGRQATAVMFSHPGNPRHPEPFFAMNQKFGYLSAAPTFYSPLTAPVKGLLRLSYALAVFDGRPEARRIESAFQNWTKKGQSS